ncbi:hypothetical protein BLS_008427 [Venturia inaequalis]|uniref:Uncharacterized protein n=1 Tax=Venturia inaequalis TaxID=5025 RepID=A0A8H3U738_VENIN|nr:hypothetical protein BLS_008427 [Venturia inaequalis]
MEDILNANAPSQADRAKRREERPDKARLQEGQAREGERSHNDRGRAFARPTTRRRETPTEKPTEKLRNSKTYPEKKGKPDNLPPTDMRLRYPDLPHAPYHKVIKDLPDGKMCPGIEAVTDGFHERKIWNFWARFELDEYCTGVDPPEFMYEKVDVHDSENMHVGTPERRRTQPIEQTQERRDENVAEQDRKDFQKLQDVCEKFPGIVGHFRAMLEMEDKAPDSMAKMRKYGEFCIKTPNLARVIDNTIEYGTKYPEFLYEVNEFANLDKKNHKFQKELVSAMRAGEMPASASRKRTREEIEEDEREAEIQRLLHLSTAYKLDRERKQDKRKRYGDAESGDEDLNDDDRALIKKVKTMAKLRNV